VTRLSAAWAVPAAIPVSPAPASVSTARPAEVRCLRRAGCGLWGASEARATTASVRGESQGTWCECQRGSPPCSRLLVQTKVVQTNRACQGFPRDPIPFDSCSRSDIQKAYRSITRSDEVDEGDQGDEFVAFGPFRRPTSRRSAESGPSNRPSDRPSNPPTTLGEIPSPGTSGWVFGMGPTCVDQRSFAPQPTQGSKPILSLV
jgi:hypothetical protein